MCPQVSGLHYDALQQTAFFPLLVLLPICIGLPTVISDKVLRQTVCAEPYSRPIRTESPGRALQEVKAKLNQFTSAPQAAAMQQSTDASEVGKAAVKTLPSGTQNQPAEPPAVFDNASAEIADIDQRLHALQTFLKAAKAGSPAVKLT